MTLYKDTDEMECLSDLFMPFLNKDAKIADDAPEEVKRAFVEYQRKAKELEENALNL